ncbi:MAG: FtsW/RodA/SpoVE family cell cycle protein, partial [Gammaproteobacteria bacterium]|nr:FtsW/RodA/SpoVE family cell cycle protein [Gammaproteobacteria bacterium]
MMNKTQVFEVSYNSRLARALRFINIDPILFLGILLLSAAGLGILYSAGDGSIELVQKQVVRLSLAFLVMFVVAQIPQRQLYLWSPWFFALGIILLVLVLAAGDVGKGAQRWLDLYVVKFQPSEMMKLITPMMLAWYLSERQLPPRLKSLLISAVLVVLPT